jgi:hypothetical protein
MSDWRAKALKESLQRKNEEELANIPNTIKANKRANKMNEKGSEEFFKSINKLKTKLKAKKSAEKLPTEKRHKEDYKRVKGNIQKSRSDLHVNKSTGKREITTDMTIHKGLTTKEKAGLKKSILNAVKKHLSGSGLHIPLAGGYTSSLIFHEMGKYIPPKDRKLMRKLIEESRPPRPPPIHSGAIDEDIPLAVIHPMDSDSESDFERNETESEDSDFERNDTESEDEEHMRRIRELNDPDSDSDDDDVYGMGFGQFMHAVKKLGTKTKEAIVDKPREIRKAAEDRVAREHAKATTAVTGSGIRRTKLHNHGVPHPVLKRPRGRPKKICL